MSSQRRALHFVLKIASLKESIKFFRDKLGMKCLRHEEFQTGCEAACNGPYSGKWSKTMIGYGPEDNHFVLELTYNYSVGSYRLGNDLQYIKLAVNKELFKKVQLESEERDLDADGNLLMKSPDGYMFIVSEQKADLQDDVTEVCLSCKSLRRSLEYWEGLLKMGRYDDRNDGTIASLSFKKDQAKLRLKQLPEDDQLDHKSAFGRIAFSCLSHELKPIQRSVENANQKVLTPYLSLETPGKATVQVVILADPDGHEICFVGDEGFRELSKVDPNADALVNKSIQEDKSDEWYQAKKKQKDES